jgi:phospholipase/lecithinase/hemolysin
MKKLAQIAIASLLFGMFVIPVQAFTSLHIFGDGISTTTNNATAGQYYYGLRESNGRVWVEVLAQRLGLGANSTTNVNWSNSPNNWSYYGQYSQNLVTNLNYFVPPQDTKTALFVVWVNCADFVADMGSIYLQGYYTNNAMWNTAVSQSLNNHLAIVKNLYAMGVRNLVMPSAVDITEIPQYDGLVNSRPADRNFIRQEVINYNAQLSGMLNQLQATLPGLKIYQPDFFGLLDNVLTNASAYGLTNALYNGVSIDAYSDPNITTLNLNGQGNNYVFWCKTAPTAKLYEIMADEAMQMIAPAQVSGFAVNGSYGQPTVNQFTMSNIPVGLNGFLDSSTNLGQASQTKWNWTVAANINSTSSTQTFTITAPPLPSYVQVGGNGPIGPGGGSTSGSANGSTSGNTGTVTATGTPGIMLTYRLRFPLAWNWP